MPTLYVDLISRISGYTGPLRQAAASTRAYTAEVASQLKALDDAAIGGVRTVEAKLAELDDRVITSAKIQRDQMRETAASWRSSLGQMRADLGAFVDFQQVASKAQIRAAADQARAMRNEAAALPRNDPGRQQLYLQARDYEDQARALQRIRSDAIQARNALADMALVTGGVLVAADVLAVREAMRLQTAMANVATISDALQGKTTLAGRAVEGAANQARAAAANWNAMTNAVLRMSQELPQSADTLTKSLYDIVSSGFDGTDALTVLHASAVGASAGLTTTANAAKGIVAVLNAFGLSAAHAADVNDIMFQTVNKGVITYDQLAQGLGQYAAMAAVASGATQHTTAAFAQAEAAIATMTLAGVPALQAGTSLNRVYTQLLHPATDLQAALRGIGFESGQQAIQTLGLKGVVDKLTATYGNNATAALKLFPEIRAARGYLALTANEGRNYARAFAAIVDPTNRAAAAQLALEHQQKTAAYQMTLLKNSAVALGIDLGRSLLPAVQIIEKGVGGFVSVLQHIPGPLRDVMGIASLAAGTILLLGGAYLRAQTMMENFQIRTAAMTESGSMLPGLMTGAAKGVGYLGAALAAASVVMAAYQASQQGVTKATTDLTQAVQAASGAVNSDTVRQSITSELVSSGTVQDIQKAGYTIPQALDAIVAGGARYQEFFNNVFGKESLGQQVAQGIDPFYHDASRKLGDIETGFQRAKASVSDAATANAQLAITADKSTNKLSGFAAQVGATTSSTDQLTEAQKALNDQFSKLTDLTDSASTAMTSLQSPSDVFDALQSTDTKAAQANAASAASAYNASLRSRTQAAQDHARALSRAATSAGKDVKASYQQRAQAAADSARAIGRADSAATKSSKDFAAEGVVSLGQWEAGLRKAGAQQTQWDRDLHTIAHRGGSADLVDSLRTLGQKGVAITRQMADMTRPQIKRINDDFASMAPSTKASLVAWTDTIQQQVSQRADYMNNLAKLAAEGRTGIVGAIEAITDPTKAAAMAKAAVDATGKELGNLSRVLHEKDAIAGSDFQSGLDVLVQIAKDKGKATVQALAQQFTGGDIDTMRLRLLQLKASITDLATKHMIQMVLNVTAPPPIKVDVIPQIMGLTPDRGPAVSGGTSVGLPGLLQHGIAGSGGTKKAHKAQGGLVTSRESHIAQIARPGEWRVWAEDETGGEAYIPLAPQKRRRSVAILDEVADRFGMRLAPKMADGALVELDLQDRIGLGQYASALGKAMARAGVGATAGAGPDGVRAPANVTGNARLGRAMANARGWGSQFGDLYALWQGESGWSNVADTRVSGVDPANSSVYAYGIPQARPASKLPLAGRPPELGGSSDPTAQIAWGLNYIAGRYGNPAGAMAHERAWNWYGSGGIRGGHRGMRLRSFAGGNVYGGSAFGSSGSGSTSGSIPSLFGLNYTVGGSSAGNTASQLQLTPYLTPDTIIQDYLSRQTAHGAKHPHPPSLVAFFKDLDASAAKMATWSADLTRIARKTNPDVANALAQMGASGQRYVDQLVNASGKRLKELTRDIERLTGSTQAATATLRDFGHQLGTQVGQGEALQAALLRLSTMGYGTLARQLEAIGGPDALKLAHEAINSPGKARRLDRKARRGAALLQGDDLTNAMSILSDIADHHNHGIHDVAGDTGLGEDDVIRLGTAIKQQIRKAHGRRFLTDLNKASRDEPYEWGGIAAPGSGIRWNEAGAGGEAMIPLGRGKRGRAMMLLRDVAGRFGYGVTPTTAVAGRPVSVAGTRTSVIVVQVPSQSDSPAIGSLTVQHTGNATPRAIVDEAFHQARVARLRRGPR